MMTTGFDRTGGINSRQATVMAIAAALLLCIFGFLGCDNRTHQQIDRSKLSQSIVGGVGVIALSEYDEVVRILYKNHRPGDPIFAEELPLIAGSLFICEMHRVVGCKLVDLNLAESFGPFDLLSIRSLWQMYPSRSLSDVVSTTTGYPSNDLWFSEIREKTSNYADVFRTTPILDVEQHRLVSQGYAGSINSPQVSVCVYKLDALVGSGDAKGWQVLGLLIVDEHDVVRYVGWVAMPL